MNGSDRTELCREHGISSPTFYKWKAKSGGMDVSEARKLKALQEENGRLKPMLVTPCWTTERLRSAGPE